MPEISPLFAVFIAAALVGLTLHALRGGLMGRQGMTIAGMDPQGLLLGLVAVAAATYFYGIQYGVALILSVMIHEFGHVAAYRVCGHSDARFRLVPLMGGVAISSSLPATQMKDFFITLMGPGISVAPMVLAYAVSAVLWDSAPETAYFLYVFGTVTAILNLFNLLPFWPLDGGRCLRVLAYRINPGLARQVTFAMSGALIAFGVWQRSMLLVFLALLGVQSAFQADTLAGVQHRLAWSQWRWALAAYAFTFAAHLWGAWDFAMSYF